jgi:uncharacterized membrane protein YkvA (DUF1232 family)
MPWWGAVLASVVAALLLLWALTVLMLWRSGRGIGGLTEAARLLPDLLRLVSRLARDQALPRRVRVVLWLLLGYLASPIDLVPDFVPVIGYADDAVVVALALRSVVRAAGSEPVERHWPGTPDGLAVVRRLAGLA